MFRVTIDDGTDQVHTFQRLNDTHWLNFSEYEEQPTYIKVCYADGSSYTIKRVTDEVA